jgi:hypothetical protein
MYVNCYCGPCCAGRLTLTNSALYFEVAGVLSYGEAKKFDLSKELFHEVIPDLTGPLGAKLFDKAIQFKSDELYVLKLIIILKTSHDMQNQTILFRSY